MMYVPGTALLWLNPPQPVTKKAALESTRANTAVKKAACRFLKLQSIEPKKRLMGKNKPAM